MSRAVPGSRTRVALWSYALVSVALVVLPYLLSGTGSARSVLGGIGMIALLVGVFPVLPLLVMPFALCGASRVRVEPGPALVAVTMRGERRVGLDRLRRVRARTVSGRGPDVHLLSVHTADGRLILHWSDEQGGGPGPAVAAVRTAIEQAGPGADVSPPARAAVGLPGGHGHLFVRWLGGVVVFLLLIVLAGVLAVVDLAYGSGGSLR